jgi:helicase
MLHRFAIEEFDVPPDKYFGAIKTALILQDWINEASQDAIVNRYDIGPGDLHAVVEMGEWLVYSMAEMGKVLRISWTREIERLALRVKYGVTDELLPIVTLRGIGRMRARRLFDSVFTSVERLRRATVDELTAVPGIGRKLAEAILKQVGAL